MLQGTATYSLHTLLCTAHFYRLNNLSIASRVHILEPQWNPSVEDQAIGRVLRLGQDKKVCVIRYVMKTTIEEASWRNESTICSNNDLTEF